MKMTIKDLYGLDITITDLGEAVEQAGMFRGFSHVSTTPEQAVADKERKAYWTDLYEKLLEL